MITWFGSVLFQSYLRRFGLLWIAGKIANAVTALFLQLPPLAFRPGTELVICAIELATLVLFIRGASEDILLDNMGLRPSYLLVPLAVIHFALSALVALFA